jgi:hypothetical protein
MSPIWWSYFRWHRLTRFKQGLLNNEVIERGIHFEFNNHVQVQGYLMMWLYILAAV